MNRKEKNNEVKTFFFAKINKIYQLTKKKDKIYQYL